MPYEKNRLFLSLAIAAITIPAVGQYINSSMQTENRVANSDAISRWSAMTPEEEAQLELQSQNKRDFASEVSLIVARNGEKKPIVSTSLPKAGDAPEVPETVLETDNSDLPASAGADDARDIPQPGEEQDFAPSAAMPPLADAQPANGPAIAMTDRDLYRLVVNNLNEEDRDNFVRAWALMTEDERADLLDQFRTGVQGTGN